MDIVSKSVRSRMMATIRGKNTKPEREVRRLLHALGYRFRLHRKDLPGRPDVVLPKHRAAILVHGCFWHRHKNCKYSVEPKSNRLFWSKKLASNAQRDTRAIAALRKAGWNTYVVWECELKSPNGVEKLRRRLERIRKPD